MTNESVESKVKKKKQEKVVLLNQYKGSKRDQISALFDDWRYCQRCEIGQLRHLKAMAKVGITFGDGNPDSGILLVGEAPGEKEEDYGVPFIGESGFLLNQIIAMTSDKPEIKHLFHEFNSIRKRSAAQIEMFNKNMVDLRFDDFFITNAIGCRPPENRTPIPLEIDNCWDRLMNIIYIVDPILIIAFGNSALASVTRKRVAKITKERGTIMDVTYPGIVGTVTYPVIPMFHPSHLIRKADWNVKGGDWDRTLDDFKKAMRLVDQVRFQNNKTPIPDRTPL